MAEPGVTYSLTDCLMSAFGMFALKSSSMLSFESSFKDEGTFIYQNMTSIFGVKQLPSDTALRARLDEVKPEDINFQFKALFAAVQRGRGLEGMESYRGDYLVSFDGTGTFASSKIKCDCCMVKNEGKENESYYHQNLCAVLVHPDQKTVLPMATEPIKKEDGAKKNDCEQNALSRIIPRLRTEHPHLPICAVMDGLHSKAPVVEMLEKQDMRYLIVAKEGDHKHLFAQMNDAALCNPEVLTKKLDDGQVEEYRYVEGLEINASNPQTRTNLLEYRLLDAHGKIIKKFAWITNYALREANVEQLARMARARWKVENETFNTLKNLGYNYEHNYGHGNKNLCSVFASLMLLAFAVDQTLERCSQVFQAAKEVVGSRKGLWERIRSAFIHFPLQSLDEILLAISQRVPILHRAQFG